MKESSARYQQFCLVFNMLKWHSRPLIAPTTATTNSLSMQNNVYVGALLNEAERRIYASVNETRFSLVNGREGQYTVFIESLNSRFYRLYTLICVTHPHARYSYVCTSCT